MRQPIVKIISTAFALFNISKLSFFAAEQKQQEQAERRQRVLLAAEKNTVQIHVQPL